jgi:hypothetical protein
MDDTKSMEVIFTMNKKLKTGNNNGETNWVLGLIHGIMISLPIWGLVYFLLYILH